jgi:hypothetical protein
VNTDGSYILSQTEAKNLLESARLKTIDNLHNQQTEMKGWTDKKVKKKTFDIGDLVLLQSPHLKRSDKLQPKWDGSYVMAERSDRLLDSEGSMLPLSSNEDNLHIFTFTKNCTKGRFHEL